jgi:uncharacterized protein (DUF488 family)
VYYRRKILLALLQQFGGSLDKMELQKYLFLFNQRKDDPFFEFIPYKYGCFSYQANQDLSTMVKYNQVEESHSTWKILDDIDYKKQLTLKDKIELAKFYNQFHTLKGTELVRYVYENYPYYAINSEIANGILSNSSLQKVKEIKPIKYDYFLFTIGYEGKTVEHYTNQLIKNDIKVLCDVRKNPVSMKYGFSKNQLKNIVENIGIKYLHFPELGIESDKRQNLNSKEDYKKLFDDYVENTLPSKVNEINNLSDIFLENKRIALTCFEADHNTCHRSRIANVLIEKFELKYPIKHI